MAQEPRSTAPGDSSGEPQASTGAARLFDVRRMIGGLFVVYGVIVTIAGLVDGEEAAEKAQGIDINLWAGLGMLALGVVFLAWLWLRPAEPPGGDDQEVMREAALRAKH
ncbi:hypothetical protein [Motilibacter aurantiacus]|uniref:hypothetical protein n=1 Tax=Motilibacter aurantiacus TaxID=2714955 RepID=UPI001409C4B2|nr:hypothetical protein [Motilibacter aurantiacus]NHC45278.1 hypothetical protein [Motilibacter aurantiacus]